MFSSSNLHAPGETEVYVHPVVLFSIVDHYSRREEGQERVIGTLLGTVNGSKVEICSCFSVPHTDTEQQVTLNTDFHTTMLALQQRVDPGLRVVGWYSTGAPPPSPDPGGAAHTPLARACWPHTRHANLAVVILYLSPTRKRTQRQPGRCNTRRREGTSSGTPSPPRFGSARVEGPLPSSLRPLTAPTRCGQARR